MNEAVLDLVIERLERSGCSDESWADLVLAACEGKRTVAAELSSDKAGGRRHRRNRSGKSAAPDEERDEPPGVYLSSIAVEGFRGVGPPAELRFSPGPGLTLVVGRNGSGKSSFAEALELLLTGKNQRWAGKNKSWASGWRNLHRTGKDTRIEASLMVEQHGSTTIRRAWRADAQLSDGAAVVQPHGKPKTTLEEVGWVDALATHRPFLSYNELGSVLETGPSALYDALEAVLGLDDVAAPIRHIRGARLSRDRTKRDAAKSKKDLLAVLRAESGSDSRVAHALDLLKEGKPDLDALRDLATGLGPDSEDEDLLRQTAALSIPSAQAVAAAGSRLREAARAREKMTSTGAERADDLARLLAEALAFHDAHLDRAEADCPVCGSTDVLGADWRVETQRETKRLSGLARAFRKTEEELTRAAREIRQTIIPLPPFISRLEATGLDPTDTIDAWHHWHDEQPAEPGKLADHVEFGRELLDDAVAALAGEALDELARREDHWKPLAGKVAAWVEQAVAVREAESDLMRLKKAEAWLKTTADEVRAERFQPIAEQTKMVWATLRHRSNVNLEDVILKGTATQRRVDLSVTVDGIDGVALGVMSQGELHALALSLFLPRAALPQSPFRFMVIDDPVQSMDPARVDGLAQALSNTAQRRQVVVFTHDDRLASAIRRMQLPSTLIRVTRRPRSEVQCTRTRGPVEQHLQDAKALLKDSRLPPGTARRVVPGICRLALEAYFTEVAIRELLKSGHDHYKVERILEDANMLNQKVSLALYGDARKTGRVMSRLRKLGGWAPEIYQACNKGSHGGYDGVVAELPRKVEQLLRRLEGR